MGNPVSGQRVYRFGNFSLDARTGELARDGNKTPLREQPLQLLLALLEKPGELVSREELIGRLWEPGTFVDFDRGLNKAVNHLREALGDSAENPQFIETLPRKGYRFVGQLAGDEPSLIASAQPTQPPSLRRRFWIAIPVTLVLLAASLAANLGNVRSWIADRLYPGPRRISSLAVIPLENLSGDRDQEYFADGLTDELITNLAKLGSTRVTSRASVIRYKGTKKTIPEIGRELNADAIVEGTVTRSGNRMRITAQLIQVSTDMHLWAEAYEQNVSETLDLQNRVAADIAHKVDIVIHPLEPAGTTNPQAYGLYLKGRYYFYQYSSRGWQQAIDHFHQAIEADPKFASAYSGLADTYLVAGAYGMLTPQEALAQGKAAAQKALQLNDNLASAHYALATAYTWYDWDWANAEKEFQRALDLNPNDALGRNWYGGYLSLLGRHREAVDEHERARQIEPFSLIINANLARALYWAHRYDEAIAQARKTLDLDPKFGVALFWLEGSLRHKELFREAVALRQALHPEQSAALEEQFQKRGFPSLLRQNAEDFKKGGALVEAARCYAQIAEKDEAIALLQNCFEHRCSSLVTLKAEPDFDVLRGDSRFQELTRRLGLQ
jgi:TolB-like protein/DNA-binding winged helix-turn-helix (wHTH) protein/Tfp pilus assembly protein PilF